MCDIKKIVELYDEIIHMAELIGAEKIAIWMDSSILALDDKTPRQMILEGKADIVLTLIRGWESGLTL